MLSDAVNKLMWISRGRFGRLMGWPRKAVIAAIERGGLIVEASRERLTAINQHKQPSA